MTLIADVVVPSSIAIIKSERLFKKSARGPAKTHLVMDDTAMMDTKSISESPIKECAAVSLLVGDNHSSGALVTAMKSPNPKSSAQTKSLTPWMRKSPPPICKSISVRRTRWWMLACSRRQHWCVCIGIAGAATDGSVAAAAPNPPTDRLTN